MKETFKERIKNFIKKLISVKVIFGVGIPTTLLVLGMLSEGLWLMAFFAAIGLRSLEKIAPSISWSKKNEK